MLNDIRNLTCAQLEIALQRQGWFSPDVLKSATFKGYNDATQPVYEVTYGTDTIVVTEKVHLWYSSDLDRNLQLHADF